jgi:hypothetical protein
MESTAKKDAINWSDNWSAIGSDSRQGKQAHTSQTVSKLFCTQTPIRRNDAE